MGRRKKKIEEVVEEAVMEEEIPIPKNIKVVEKKEPKRKPVKEKRVLPLIPLKIFCHLSGKKWDQMAGFRLYATKAELKPRTVPDWHKKLQEFMEMPVK